LKLQTTPNQTSLVSSAWAALFSSTSLFLVHHGVHDLQKRWQSTSAAAWRGGVDGAWAVVGGLHYCDLCNSWGTASTALWLVNSFASGTLALQLALGLGTVDWLSTLALAVELFAHWSALWLWSDTGGVAAGRLADGLTLRAAILLAQVLGAADCADWTFAVDCALRAGYLFTLHLALGASTHWVAHSRAGWVIALPFAHGVALLSGGNSQNQKESNEYSLHW